MKKLRDFYKKHFVVFLIIFSVLAIVLLLAAIFAFGYFVCGIDEVKWGLRTLAITFGLAVVCLLVMAFYCITKK